MSNYQLIHKDAVKWARRYAAHRKCGRPLPLFHALLGDAPYHLQSTVKRFGKTGSAKAKYGTDGAFQRASAGFMGKKWDGGDVAFRPSTWRAFYRILHPGAFGMAFGGSRTSHRMTVAIEDAGFRIHPQIGWVYGSGFPKATRLDKQIDKMAKAEREVLDIRDVGPNIKGDNYHRDQGEREIAEITKPATGLACAWEGHRYGLQALKPALEPIIVFQKPYEGKPVDSMVETGAGALNIEGARIGNDDITRKGKGWASANHEGYKRPWMKNAEVETFGSKQGRWPANLVISHSPECKLIGSIDAEGYQINRFTDGARPFGHGAGHEYKTELIEGGKVPVYECVERCAVKELDRQTNALKGGKFSGRHTTDWKYHGGKRDESPGAITYGDSGGASRFFYNADWTQEQFEEILPIRYQAKAAISERERGLIHRVPCIECKRLYSIVHLSNKGKKEYCRRCVHPTVKPISLTRWLATLLLPPDLYAPRRLFVPFAGVASEMIGAFQAGWEIVTGIEIEEEYIPIGQTRLDYWMSKEAQS